MPLTPPTDIRYKVLALRMEGRTATQISRDLSISRQRVYACLRHFVQLKPIMVPEPLYERIASKAAGLGITPGEYVAALYEDDGRSEAP